MLAGLDDIDAVFTEFVGTLDGIIRNGKSREYDESVLDSWSDPIIVEVRQHAVEVVLSITSGAYQTGLLTYFIQRDLFPAIMKVSTESWLVCTSHRKV